MMKSRFKRGGIVLLFMIWVASIFIFSSESYHSQTIIPFLERWWNPSWLIHTLPDIHIVYVNHLYSLHQAPYSFIEFVFRKSAHLFMYAGLGGLSFLMLGRVVRQLWVSMLVAMGIVTLIASLDEWNQSNSIGRTSSIHDVYIDMTGAFIGMLFFLFISRVVSGKKK